MRGAGLPDYGGMTYPLFLCCGLLPWQWFSELLTRMVGLFSNHCHLLRQTTVPWPALVASEVLVALFGFCVMAAVFSVFLTVWGYAPQQAFWTLLPFLLLMGLFAIGLGLCLAVVQVFFRDVGLGLPVVLQVWFWATPIVYPVMVLPEQFNFLPMVNVLSAPIQGIQHIFMPEIPAPESMAVVALSVITLGLILLSRYMIHRNWDAMRDEF